MAVVCFERQPHILFIIIIIHVIANIMEVHEVPEGNVLVQVFVFYEVFNKKR